MDTTEDLPPDNATTAKIVAFPKLSAAPAPSTWDLFEPGIRRALAAEGCHPPMIEWIVADVARRWLDMFPGRPPLSINVDTAQVKPLTAFIKALENTHIKSVLSLEVELYRATHLTPGDGACITRG